MDLKQIETLAHTYRADRDHLGVLVSALQRDLAAAKERYLPGIKAAVQRAAGAKEALHNAVEGAPELFQKPKTQVFHGIKTGWVKAKDALEIPDPAATVAAIRAHCTDEQAALLIAVKETPNKKALERMAEDPNLHLAELGVALVPGADQVVVHPVDSEVDKLVGALLAEAEQAEN